MLMRQIRSWVRVIQLEAALLLLISAPAFAGQSAASAPASASTVSALSAITPPSGRIAPASNLRQLMLGILFPASNVIFAAQDDLSTFKPAENAAVSPNPLTSIYNGWPAVENAALALSDASNLLLLPGRLCSNGQPVPLRRQDWANYVQILREAAAASYRAAQSQSQDAMVQVSDTLTRACDACHAAYRDKYKDPGNAKVCLP